MFPLAFVAESLQGHWWSFISRNYVVWPIFFLMNVFIALKCAWGKFRQLLPLLTNRHLPFLTRGKVYSSCVRSVMLHAAETWAMKVDTLNRLRRNDRAMIRWICNVRAKDEVSSDSLLTKLGIQDLDVVLRTSRMRWFGHVERSTGWIASWMWLHRKDMAGQGNHGMKCWRMTERS